MNPKKKEIQKKFDYERLGEYSLEEVFTLVPVIREHNRKSREVYKSSEGTYYVNLNSLRLRLFKTKGVVCVKCGLKGQYFALERLALENPHFNLYGIDLEGDEVLFTKDHIIPSSRNGSNALFNLQTMCYPCNSLKGNKLENQ